MTPQERDKIRAVNSIGHAIDLWVGELARRGRKQATRTKYYEILFPFADHVGDKLLHEITPNDCRTFLDKWVNSSPSTMALYVSCLRGFFTFLLREEIIDRSPMVNIERPKRMAAEDLDVVTVSTEDVARMIDACEEWDEYLCLALLLYMGPRRSAAANTRRSDVDLGRGTIRFKEKGGKVIVKPIPSDLAAIIRMGDEKGVWASPTAYLIPNRRPPRTSKRSAKVIYAIVKRVADRARVDAHPHALRAAFAVQFEEQHPDQLFALKDLMGHSRLETTQVYLRRRNKQRGMEAVRDLSWGGFSPGSALRASGGMPPAGFEPALGDKPPSKQDRAVTGGRKVYDPLRAKVESLREPRNVRRP